MKSIKLVTVVVSAAWVSTACSIPTDGSRSARLQLTVASQTVASQTTNQQAFAPEVTVVDRAEVRAEVDGRTVESASATIDQGQSVVRLDIGLPDGPADFVATIVSNNDTPLLEGRTDPIEPADGDVVNIQLGFLRAVPGLTPATVPITMRRAPPGPSVGGPTPLAGLGGFELSSIGPLRQSEPWTLASVTPTPDMCGPDTLPGGNCTFGLVTWTGQTFEVTTGGVVRAGIVDSVFVVLFHQVGTYEVVLDTPSGSLVTTIVGDSATSGGGASFNARRERLFRAGDDR